MRRRRWPWIVAGLLLLGAAGLGLAWTPDIPVAQLRARYASPASEFVEIAPGLTVHLRDEGPKDAPAVVLLHGSNASLQTWEPWVARLKDRYRLISLDLPGHGLTGPSPGRDYSSASSVAIVDAVARRRGLTRFALVGHSMGGGIAVHYALARPDRLSALILVDASGAPWRRSGDLPIGLRIARLPVVRDVAEHVTPRSMIEKSLRQSVSVQAIVTAPTVDRYWDLLRYPGNRRATLDRFSEPYEGVTEAAFAGFAVPTLILWGVEDRLIPVASAAWFAHAIPRSRVMRYAGVGHLPMEEIPDRSAADVARFMAALPPS